MGSFYFIDVRDPSHIEMLHRGLKTYLSKEEYETVKSAPAEWLIEMYSGTPVDLYGGNYNLVMSGVKRFRKSTSGYRLLERDYQLAYFYRGQTWEGAATPGQLTLVEMGAHQKALTMLRIMGFEDASVGVLREDFFKRTRVNFYNSERYREYFRAVIVALQARLYTSADETRFTMADYDELTFRARAWGFKLHPDDTPILHYRRYSSLSEI